MLVYQNGCVSNNAMEACEDHVENCKILTQFNVEPEENWILYKGGNGQVVHGKAKPKMFGKYETWITNDKQIRDPHACLAKDQLCQVSIFRSSNPWQGSTLKYYFCPEKYDFVQIRKMSLYRQMQRCVS